MSLAQEECKNCGRPKQTLLESNAEYWNWNYTAVPYMLPTGRWEHICDTQLCEMEKFLFNLDRPRWAPFGPFCVCSCWRTLNLHHWLHWSQAASNYDENLAIPLSEECDCSFLRCGKVERVNVKFPVEMTFICWFHHFSFLPSPFSFPQSHSNHFFSAECHKIFRSAKCWFDIVVAGGLRVLEVGVKRGEILNLNKKPFCMQMFTPFPLQATREKGHKNRLTSAASNKRTRGEKLKEEKTLPSSL